MYKHLIRIAAILIIGSTLFFARSSHAGKYFPASVESSGSSARAASNPLTPPLAPSDYNAVAGFGTAIDPADTEVVIQNIQLASETIEADGRHRLEFTGDLRNTGIGYYDNLAIRFQEPGPGWNVEVVSSINDFSDLAPNATVTSAQRLVLKAPATDAVTVKNEVLAGQRTVPTGDELYQFRLPAVAVDQATADAFTAANNSGNNQVIAQFNQMTPALLQIGPGMLLLENPRAPISRVLPVSGLTSIVRSHEVSPAPDSPDFGKIRTTKMLEVLSKTTDPSGNVVLTCIQHGGDPPVPFQFPPDSSSPVYRGLLDNLRTGTLVEEANTAFDADPSSQSNDRNPWFPSLGNSVHTSGEDDARGQELLTLLSEDRLRHFKIPDLRGFFTAHFPFNEMQLAPGLKLDGQLNVGGFDLKLRTKFRNGSDSPSKVVVTMSTGVEVDLRVTAEIPGVNNTNAALLDREKTLATFSLPKIVFNIGGVPQEIEPIITLKIGATVDASTRIVVPMQTSFRAGIKLTWDPSLPPGQQISADPFQTYQPLGVTDPNLEEALFVTASAFAEASVELRINELGGPYFAARATGTFEVTPLADPWWNLDFDLTYTAGGRLRVLVFPPVDIPLLTWDDGPNVPNLFHRHPLSPPPPGPHNAANPASGINSRWARGAFWNGGASPITVKLTRVGGTPEDVIGLMPAISEFQPIFRINGKGDFVWGKYKQSLTPLALAATPDGGFALAGHYLDSYFLSRHDGNGNLLWSRGFDLTNDSGGDVGVFVSDVVVREPNAGSLEIYVAGYRRDDSLGTQAYDPFLIKYDGDGGQIWAKYFASVNGDICAAAILLRDGNLLLAGTNVLSHDGINPPLPGQPAGGWLMKVDPDGATPTILWAKRTHAGDAMNWNSVTEGPDGSIYAGGHHGHTFGFEPGALLVGKFKPNGDYEAMVIVGEAMTNDKTRLLDPNFDFHDWLPNSGRSDDDSATTVRWTPAGLVVGGTTGNGDNRAAVLMALSDTLGIRWFTTHEDAGGDTLNDIAVTDQGLLTGGFTQSMGSRDRMPGGLFLKSPFEGKVDLRLNSNALSKYLQPSVWSVASGAPEGFNEHIDITSALTPATQQIVPGTSVDSFTDFTFGSWTDWARDDSTSPTQHTITSLASSGGTISPLGPTMVPDGGSYIFTITPSPGYRIYDVTVDGISVGTPSSYTFTNVTSNHTINAVFLLNDHELTGTVTLNGAPLAGVELTLSGNSDNTYTTNANGTYYFSVNALGTYTVTPSLSGHSFTPTNHTYTNLLANQIGDFAATSTSSNSNPTIGPIGNLTVRVHNTGDAMVTVNDTETPNNISVTATSDNQAVLPDANINVSGFATDWIVSVTPESAGTAVVTVNASDGQGGTATATFTVTAVASACTAPPSGMIAWYRAEVNAEDAAGDELNSHDGTASPNLTYDSGKVRQAFVFDGSDAHVSVPWSNDFNFGSGDFSIDAWYMNNISGTDTIAASDDGNGNKWIFRISDGRLEFIMATQSGSGVSLSQPITPFSGRFFLITVTRSGNTWKFFVDDHQQGMDMTESMPLPTTNAPITFGYTESFGGFSGMLDEIEIFNRALTLGEVQGIYRSSRAGKCLGGPTPTPTPNTAPSITPNNPPAQQPGTAGTLPIANVNDAEQAENTLSVTVNGGPSATVNNVTVSNISIDAAGVVSANVAATCNATTANFTLLVTDSGNLSASTQVTVTINPLPGAPTAGSNSPINPGGTLHLTASNIQGASYSWTGPNGFTSSEQNPSIPNVTLAATGAYAVTATVGGCSLAPATTDVVINSAPSITPNSPLVRQPGSDSSIAIASVNDDEQAENTLSVTVHGASSSTINGVTVSSLSIDAGGVVSANVAATCSATTAHFTLMVTDAGSLNSSAQLTITVNPLPGPPTAGSNSPVNVGGTLNLTASTIAGASYSWTGPNGFTSNQRNPSIANVTLAAAGTYTVTAKVGGCSLAPATTNAVINSAPSIIPNNPPARQPGSAGTLTIANASDAQQAPNTLPVRVNGGASATVNNVTISNISVNAAGVVSATVTAACNASTANFTLMVTDSGNLSSSTPITISINPLPGAPTAGSNSPVTVGGTLNLTASNIANATYSWSGPNGFTSNQQNPSIGNVTLATGGTYSVTARVNNCALTAAQTVVVVNSAPQPLDKIVFHSTRNGNQDIYSMNADGSNQTRLTTHAAADSHPAWSKDRTKIVFTSARNGNLEIYVMNANGSNQTRLTNNSASDDGPGWSPDGTKIVFWSARNGNAEIYVMNANGTNQTRLTNNSAADVQPGWSPDGSRIVFTSNRSGLINSEIYVMNANGTGVTRLTSHRALDHSPDWSPDGTKIVFASNRRGRLDFEIWVMNATGTNPVRVTSGPRASIAPNWSRDGSKIVFASNRVFLLNFEIYSMNANGSNPTRLTSNSVLDLAPNW